MRRKAQVVFGLALGAFLGGAGPASAFKCRENPSVVEASKLRDFVFAGRVVWDLSFPHRQQVLVQPLASYKGCLRSWVVVRGREAPFACAVTLKVGERYLFFTSTPTAEWIHEVWGCDPNAGLKYVSQEELEFVSRLEGCSP